MIFTNSSSNKGLISKIITSKRIKYLRINLIKDVKDLCSDNYKTLKKTLQIIGSTYVLMDRNN